MADDRLIGVIGVIGVCTDLMGNPMGLAMSVDIGTPKNR
jgi:hypothetical protein